MAVVIHLSALFFISVAVFAAKFVSADISSTVIPTISASPAVFPDPGVVAESPPVLAPDVQPLLPSPRDKPAASPPNLEEASAPEPSLVEEFAPAPAPTTGMSGASSATLASGVAISVAIFNSLVYM
ncbi:hypothetical protein AMTRI_Chr06g192370 [Amborella trichopoda]|uniref:Arabinogalactan protein n=1 Tax=Amborella trichopoda TaxID=13333 RepID=W1P8L3_AMBTC|nr:classical arabinogalactan protein 3 [Amborella trichopoda]ERN06202.1 hypothetical protein AMTR_s00016p00158790 [Amborella trichopoda]|eukprot:XP_006844527.1 classical arabinogalactan protein 3 [Amborella trichopoda]